MDFLKTNSPKICKLVVLYPVVLYPDVNRVQNYTYVFTITDYKTRQTTINVAEIIAYNYELYNTGNFKFVHNYPDRCTRSPDNMKSITTNTVIVPDGRRSLHRKELSLFHYYYSSYRVYTIDRPNRTTPSHRPTSFNNTVRATDETRRICFISRSQKCRP